MHGDILENRNIPIVDAWCAQGGPAGITICAHRRQGKIVSLECVTESPLTTAQHGVAGQIKTRSVGGRTSDIDSARRREGHSCRTAADETRDTGDLPVVKNGSGCDVPPWRQRHIPQPVGLYSVRLIENPQSSILDSYRYYK